MFNPYDQYNQNPTPIPYMQPSAGILDTSDQTQRMADLLRQGYQQPQQQGGGNNDGLNSLAKLAGTKLAGMGGNALPQNSMDAMTNSITPNFQSMNMQAPTMNMTGAGALTPSFSAMPQTVAPEMMSGFNPSMFAGMF
jgi:hypothetical protein